MVIFMLNCLLLLLTVKSYVTQTSWLLLSHKHVCIWGYVITFCTFPVQWFCYYWIFIHAKALPRKIESNYILSYSLYYILLICIASKKGSPPWSPNICDGCVHISHATSTTLLPLSLSISCVKSIGGGSGLHSLTEFN